VGTNVLVALVAAAALVAVLPAALVLAWVLLVLVVAAGRLALANAHVRMGAAANAARWGRYYLIGAAVAGSVWGSAGWVLLVNHSAMALSVLVFALGGVAAVGVSTMASLLASYVVFLVPVLAPTAVVLFQLGGDFLPLAVLTVVFGAILFATAVSLNRSLQRAIQLGLTNRALVSGLDRAREDLQERNRSLDAEIAEHRETQARLRQSEQNFRALAEAAEAAIVVLSDRVLYVNPAAERLLGSPAAELVGRASAECLLAGLSPRIRELLAAGREASVPAQSLEMAFVTHEGETRWGDITIRNIHFRGEPAVMATVFDITERKAFAEALFREKERLQVTLESIGDGVLATDMAGRVEYLNAMAAKMTGWDLADARGRHLTEVARLIDEGNRQAVKDPVADCHGAGRPVTLSGDNVLVDKAQEKEFSVEVTAAPIRDREGGTVGAVVVLHDVTDLRGLARQLAYQAGHDPLTGLINRREFEDRLQHVVRGVRDGQRGHALCYLDLDQFKMVNDSCGHIAGDTLLKRLAEVLSRRIRGQDTLARLGGDEFGVLLVDCTLDQAELLAADLRDAVSEYRFRWDEQVFQVGVSIGLVPITSAGASLTDLLRAADSACYVAKDRGRNHVHVFQQDDTDLAWRRGQIRWVQRIQRALDRRQFRLVAQPIVALSPDEAGCPYSELLVRMVNEGGGLVEPSHFVPAAERYHLMPAIDQWVIDHAFDFIAGARRAVYGTWMINLSGQSLSDLSFLSWVLMRLEANQVEPGQLCFEITETALMPDLGGARDFIQTLKARGCRFALDDFGTGTSSFAYLKHLPVDFIKIDGSFVKNIATDQADFAMVKSIHRVARDLGIRTIAEGVEDAAAEQVLRELGVDYVQGRWIAPPVAVASQQGRIMVVPPTARAVAV
jgi:diguanylate cyclase (GGDEF)-like protein/PAS domain S-box-containing protein